MIKVLWHLPYNIVGGVETLYSTIFKYKNNPNLEYFVSCDFRIRPHILKMFPAGNICSFIGVEDLTTVIRSVNPNLIIDTHGSNLYESLNRLKSEGLSYPVLEICHGSHLWYEHNVNLSKEWTKHIVCVSKSSERLVKQHIDNISTSVIINGVDTNKFKPVKKQFVKTIGYIGRFLEGDKKIKHLVQAFVSLVPTNARLILIGGLQEEIIELREYTKKLRVEDKVKIYPYTTYPENYYQQMGVFTVRSEAEGYCNSVAEALASGVPCVCFNFGGILDHIDPGTVLIANTQEEYVSHLKTLMSSESLRSQMISKGLDFINRQGNHLVMIQKYEDLILKYQEKNEDRSFTIEVKQEPTKEKELSFKETINASKQPIVGVVNFTWQGIYNATKPLVDLLVNGAETQKDVENKILAQNPKAVLFSGISQGFDRIALMIKRKAPNIPIYFFYHAGISHYSFSKTMYGSAESHALASLINLHNSGVVQKIALASPGFAEVLRASGIRAYYCGNVLPDEKVNINPPLEGFNIGNWNRPHDHKHITVGNTLFHLIEYSKVHCLRGFPTIPGVSNAGLIVHPEMPREDLLNLYSKMRVNLQLSFIETFNISVMEMWRSERPVILSSGNYVLVENFKALKKLCFVEDSTNPVAVANKCVLANNNFKEIKELQLNALKTLKLESLERWHNFFNGV